jgi:hypothetical protein
VSLISAPLKSGRDRDVGFSLSPMLLPRFAVATAVFLLFAASPAQAQESTAQAQETHGGFWLGLGAGSGVEFPSSLFHKRPKGIAAAVRAGGFLTPRVLFGAEILWREVHRGPSTPFRGNGSFTLRIYPGRTGGLFIKGGIGLAFVGERIPAQPTFVRHGLGLTAGVGLDMPLLGSLYLTPGVDFVHQAFNEGNNLQRVHRQLLATIGLTLR